MDNNLILNQTIAHCWKDPSARAEFLQNPAGMLRQRGMEIGADTRVTALEDTAQLTHVVVPPGDPDKMAEQLRDLAKSGRQFKLVEAQPGEMVVSMPVAPEGFEAIATHPIAATAGGPLGEAMRVGIGSTRGVNTSVSVSIMVVAVAVAVATASLS